MKDFTKKELREGDFMSGEVENHIKFCLSRLYKDRKHLVTEEIINGLTFEELIGTLLEAEYYVNELKLQGAKIGIK